MAIMFGATTLSDRGRIAAHDPRLCHAIRGVIGRGSAVGLLSSIPAPTLVVSGTENTARPPAWSDELVDGLQDATLWRLHAVGHSPVLEVPDRVLPRILAFATG